MASLEARRNYFREHTDILEDSSRVAHLREKHRVREPFDDDEYYFLATTLVLWSSATDFVAATKDDLDLLDRMLALFFFAVDLSVPQDFDEYDVEWYEDHIETTYDESLLVADDPTKQLILNCEDEFCEITGPEWSSIVTCIIDEYGRGRNSYRVELLFEYFSDSLLLVAERVQHQYDIGAYN